LCLPRLVLLRSPTVEKRLRPQIGPDAGFL
jgi:hypothetical protein